MTLSLRTTCTFSKNPLNSNIFHLESRINHFSGFFGVHYFESISPTIKVLSNICQISSFLFGHDAGHVPSLKQFQKPWLLRKLSAKEIFSEPENHPKMKRIII